MEPEDSSSRTNCPSGVDCRPRASKRLLVGLPINPCSPAALLVLAPNPVAVTVEIRPVAWITPVNGSRAGRPCGVTVLERARHATAPVVVIIVVTSPAHEPAWGGVPRPAAYSVR